MNALSQLVLGDDSTLTIEPLHLSITQTFKSGTTSNLHLMENGDLGITKGLAASIVKSSADGALIIGLGVDDDHDEIHYTYAGGTSRAGRREGTAARRRSGAASSY